MNNEVKKQIDAMYRAIDVAKSMGKMIVPFWESNLNPITLFNESEDRVTNNVTKGKREFLKYYNVPDIIQNKEEIDKLFDEKYQFRKGYTIR